MQGSPMLTLFVNCYWTTVYWPQATISLFHVFKQPQPQKWSGGVDTIYIK